MHDTETNQWSATVGATDAVVLASNIGRRSITIGPPNAGRITVTFGKTATLDQGITIQAGTSPRTLTYHEIGMQLYNDMHAIADAAGRITGGTETFLARY